MNLGDLKAIVAGVLLFSAIGAALFFVIRSLIPRKKLTTELSRSVTRAELLKVSLVVSGLLILVWFMESGSSTAKIIYAAAILGLQVFGMIILHRSKKK